MKNWMSGSVMAIAALVLATGCGGGPKVDSSGSTRAAELRVRGFQDIVMEAAQKDESWSSGPYAVAHASAGSCRLRLEWSASRDWQLTDDGKPVNIPGELTAAGILRLPQYQHCA